MNVRLNPYLGFRDTARPALEFYHTIFGGELVINSFKDFHASGDPAEDDKVMHGMLTGDNGIVFMASDTPNAMQYEQGRSISMSLSGEAVDEAMLRGFYEKLAEDGTISLPLEKAPWGDYFGMIIDKFGVQWMVNIAGAKQQ